MAHAWKACWGNTLGGSNPPSSAVGGACDLRLRGARALCVGELRVPTEALIEVLVAVQPTQASIPICGIRFGARSTGPGGRHPRVATDVTARQRRRARLSHNERDRQVYLPVSSRPR